MHNESTPRRCRSRQRLSFPGIPPISGHVKYVQRHSYCQQAKACEYPGQSGLDSHRANPSHAPLIGWAFAHGSVTPSSMEFEARTADVKPTVLWSDRNISAGSALFMLAKLILGSLVWRARSHRNRLTITPEVFLRHE